MSRALIVRRAGPGMTVQDQGRTGYLRQGLSRGGAADRLALAEGAALLGQSPDLAALEMAGAGGEFEASEAIRIALTGAPMRATLDGVRIAWNACHAIPAGARLGIGACEAGTYGYLHAGGGFVTPRRLGSRSVHHSSGLGSAVRTGDTLPVGPDPRPDRASLRLDVETRMNGGVLRLVRGPQTELFPQEEIARFEAGTFHRDTRGNRMGVRLLTEGAGLQSDAGLSVVSEVVVPGDVQITGDGTPFVLLAECQTTGGYPRIGTVIPADLPRIAQAGPGTSIRFRFVSLEEALETEAAERRRRDALPSSVLPLTRRPEDIPDLLSYGLVGGVTAGDDLDRDSSE